MYPQYGRPVVYMILPEALKIVHRTENKPNHTDDISCTHHQESEFENPFQLSFQK